MDTASRVLRIGLPSGSLQEPTFALFAKAGFNISGASRSYKPAVDDPDLVIRTSGETRISNFLLWQSAYAEYEFTPTLWPDFTAAELSAIVGRYAGRVRRFGAAAPA